MLKEALVFKLVDIMEASRKVFALRQFLVRSIFRGTDRPLSPGARYGPFFDVTVYCDPG